MKKLSFEYSTGLLFANEINSHCFTLRCLPVSDDRQIIGDLRCIITPDDKGIWCSNDSFGNSLLCGRIPEAHNSFSFKIKGIASVKSVYRISGEAPYFYGFSSKLTEPTDEIMSFFGRIRSELNGSVTENAMTISDRLFNSMRYEKDVTNVNTTAGEAFAAGAGVCQDYAHIFLSLCRLGGIRCRYVSGLAYQSGETHAWAEINDGSFWIGIDPANNCFCSDNYIKICHGRDYADCPIERGLYLGSSVCTQEIFSAVTEI
ncbi:MAG: transglutaminase domain-containing protein [Oscillospiraceae bacterium]